MSSFKPTGYNSASPYFIVADAQKFIALMQTIFDAKDLRRYDLPNGKIAHAEILIDDTVVMLSDATEKYPPMPVVMHVYVADVDAVFQKAMEAGCTVVEQPKTQEGDPDKRGTFTDFSGNMWSIGTQLSE